MQRLHNCHIWYKKQTFPDDDNLLKQLDLMVTNKLYPNRSKAIQDAVADKLKRLERFRLAQECAKLDPNYEQSLAEEGFSMEIDEWPEY